MRTSFKASDVILLLKDITGTIEGTDTKAREKLIQSGKHYSEMLPIEYKPSEKYLEIYNSALLLNAEKTAQAVGAVAEKIYNLKGENVVLVSLARAGTPIGILIKNYLENKYKISVPHYTISIIRGRGIDKNAINYILEHHSAESIQFIDGWTGKGAIITELNKSIEEYPQLDKSLAVLSDPANITDICGTHADFLIPSSCLNSTVSGLMSRTVLRDDLILKNDFHGVVFYDELKAEDRTYEFIDKVKSFFNSDKKLNLPENFNADYKGIDEVNKIAKEFDISDINLIKPSIGETTRVLLRRYPWRILIKTGFSKSEQLKHILRLAEEKNVPVLEYPLKNYMACGLIKSMSADL